MDVVRAYRRWLWSRLALLLPSQAAALAVNLWLTLREAAAPWIKMVCVSVAAALGLLIAYLLVQTVRCHALHRRSGRPEAHLLRRELRPLAPLTASALLLILALVGVPNLFETPSEGVALRPVPLRVTRPDAPIIPTVEWPVAALPAATPAAAPIAVEPPGRPQELPAVPQDPLPLSLADRDFEFPTKIELPYPPKATEPLAQETEDERTFPRARPSLEELFPWKTERAALVGLLLRPLPEEWNKEALPAAEARLDGMIFLGQDRIPALTLAVDIPIGRNDSIEATWLAAMLPQDDGPDQSNLPNWHHATVAYLRRFAGYTRHAAFDLSASVGMAGDIFGNIEGLSTSSHPRYAPYIGIDAAFWQDGPAGLLVHVGQSFPIPAIGYGLQMTDLKLEVRIDLSDRISLHGGYRMLLLRFTDTKATVDSSENPLNDHLGGPFLGVDVRF